MNSRKIVFDALLKQEEGSYSNLTLNSIIKNTTEDVSFITHLFYGVIERKITLDYIIDKYLDKSIKTLKIEILLYFRMALYEALFMKTPHYAVVNEYVSIIKKTKFSKLCGFVNAFLRKACRYDLKYLDNKPLNIKYSINEDIVDLLIENIGENNTEDFLENALKPAPVFARINTLKDNLTIPDNFQKTQFNDLYFVENFSSKNEDINNGNFYIQDLSAHYSVTMLSPKENDRILDVCSAPGGKSFTSYLLTNGKSEIISCDKYGQRVNLIEKSSKKLGFTIKTIVNDATIFNENLGFFDCVICDVPCSGIGVIRRKPEIKYKDVNDFKELYDLQKNIIDVSLKYVNKGGKFLYSTCTLNKKENQEMVEYLLKNNPDFKLLEQKTILPKDFNGDGFFAAVLLRG